MSHRSLSVLSGVLCAALVPSLVGAAPAAVGPSATDSAATSSARDESTDGRAGIDAMRGRETFRIFCASCHGYEAKGDGRLAEYLTIAPADLTRIRERHDGEFPHELVEQIIDGRKPVRGHGSPDMPVWGDVFQNKLAGDSDDEATPEDRAKRKIGELVMFVRSIQLEEADAEE